MIRIWTIRGKQAVDNEIRKSKSNRKDACAAFGANRGREFVSSVRARVHCLEEPPGVLPTRPERPGRRANNATTIVFGFCVVRRTRLKLSSAHMTCQSQMPFRRSIRPVQADGDNGSNKTPVGCNDAVMSGKRRMTRLQTISFRTRALIQRYVRLFAFLPGEKGLVLGDRDGGTEESKVYSSLPSGFL